MRVRMLTPWALGLVASAPGWTQGAPASGNDMQDLLELLNTPVVTASKSQEKLSEAPATLVVLRRSDLEARGYRDLSEILEDLPGFDVTRFYGDTYMKPYARGFRNTIGEPFLVMVDGMVFNHLWYNNAEIFLTAVPLSNIDRVEVVYGPASALYGANAFNGVINVITRKDAEANGSSGYVKAYAGSFDTKVADFSYMLKQGDLRLSFTGRVGEGDIDPKAPDRSAWLSEKYRKNRTIYGRMLDFNTDKVGKLTSPIHTRGFDLRLFKGGFEAGITYLNLNTGYGLVYTYDGYQPGLQVWSRPQYSFHVKFDHDVAPNLSVSTMGRFRRDEVGPESRDNYTFWDSASKSFLYEPTRWRTLTGSFIFTQDWSWNPSKAWSVAAGYLAESQSQQTKYLLNFATPVDIPTAQYDPAQMPAAHSASYSDLSHVYILRHGAYLQGKYRLADNQSLVAGARSDWSTTFGGARTLRGGYVGNFGGWGTKLLYGQGYNEPSWRLLGGGWAKSGSNPNLHPERSNTLEGSLSYTASKWSLSADLYSVQSKSVVINLPGGATNAGNYDVKGVDLHAQWLAPLFKEFKVWAYVTHLFKADMNPFANALSHYTDYTLLSSAQKTALGSDQGTYEIGDIAKTKLYLGTTMQFNDSMGLTLLGRHFSDRPSVATNPVNEYGAYTTVDAVFTAKFSHGLAIQGRVRNLLDKEYVTPGNRQGSAGFTPGGFDARGDWTGPGGDYNSVIPGFSRNFDVSLRWQF